LVIALAARHELPPVYWRRAFVAGGGVVSYGPDIVDQYRRAAGYVDRILKGGNPADLPVQAPTKYELVIKLTARRGGGLRGFGDIDHRVVVARLQPFWLLRWRLWFVLAVSGPSHRTEPSTLLGNGLESRRKLLRHVLDKGACRRRHAAPACIDQMDSAVRRAPSRQEVQQTPGR
jgi:ABC transporter substrate binding protein